MYLEYKVLIIDGNKVIGLFLFCRDCRDGEKFGFIMEKIFLFLVLEYYFRFCIVEIDSIVIDELVNFNFV